MSNIYNIGRITYQEAIRQPLFYIVLAVSAVLLLISPLFCLFTFDKELSMIREVGMATITFAGILIALIVFHELGHFITAKLPMAAEGRASTSGNPPRHIETRDVSCSDKGSRWNTATRPAIDSDTPRIKDASCDPVSNHRPQRRGTWSMRVRR